MVDNSFLTSEGHEKLREELVYLRDVRRQEVAKTLKLAVEDGDLNENAGYDEAKREQAFVEGRIQEIETILANSQLLDMAATYTVAALGADITIVEDGCAPETYTIVGRTEADPSNGRISNESPLGKALLGRKIGDKVEVATPGGKLQFKIVDIA
ncbi:MAG: transcription elongation factor GreA [Chloroflexi bacterium]|nr:transcription elongation factor GreA [Chloroflexota bacterium]